MSSLSGKITGIYVGAKRGVAKTAVESAELIAGHGIRGDAHAGLSLDRQMSVK